MQHMMSTSLALCVLHIAASLAQFQGMMCKSCTDVALPEHCRQSMECGQGEICYTREFIDHDGLSGFHLGCEDNRTCELLREAHTIFGKRDIRDVNPAPLSSCYQCCSTEECNNQLCQVSKSASPSPSSTGTTQRVTCMSCEGAESPEHCIQTVVCGSNEVCFTREYTDHRGYRGYRLGCESQKICTIFLNAQTLFGKRRLPAPAPPEECFDCCSSHECNTRLCQTPSYRSTSLPTSTTKVSTQSASTAGVQAKDCPDKFLAFKHNCYLFDIVRRNWNESRRYCKQYGADLLSIHSLDENNFLNKELLSLNDSFATAFWTGGIYSHSAGRFEWSDGSPFNYTNWHPGFPRPFHASTDDYHIVVTNPAYVTHEHALMYDTWQWNTFALVCETKRQ